MRTTAKFILLAALPAVALAAGCSKNEVIPVENEPAEITYQTLETKAASNFSTSNKFYSYAYFLEKDKTWAAKAAEGKAYISNSRIEYVTDMTYWKNTATTYYWPKQGSLTFFAWTDYTAAPAVSGCTISCSNTKGINTTGYAVTSNQNKDLMVADIAADQKTNTVEYTGWEKGVPTIFKHVLSNLVFTIKTDEGTSGNKYEDGMFELKSITLKNVSTKGDYTQGSPTASTAPWSNQGTSANLSAYSGTGMTVSETAQTVTPAANDYYIVLPQNFTDTTPVIEIVYTITTNYAGTPVTETVTETKDLKSIYKDNWVNGKKYTLNIILGVTEILWDPDVTDWTTVTADDINI